MSRSKLRAEQKREADAIDRGDIGRAGIFLFMGSSSPTRPLLPEVDVM